MSCRIRLALPFMPRNAAPLICLMSATLVASADQATLVTNGNFEQWAGGVPVGWKVEVGARNGGEQPESEVKKMVGPALMMRGDESTMAWRSVSQPIKVKPGGRYRLTFQGRSKGVTRQGRQYDNCYVGWMSFDARGKLIGREFADLSRGASDWKGFELEYTVPDNAKSTSLTVFLSKTGLMAVKGFQAEAIGNIEPAEAAANLARNGSFTNWSAGRPDGWKLEVGASNGGAKPLSKVAKLGEAGLSLSGNARTLAWQSVSQTVAVKPGKPYTVRFDAQAVGVRREGRQYNNCYVGVMSFDGGGERVGLTVEDLSGAESWKEYTLRFVPPAEAAKTDILIFLSKSGTLQIKNLRLGEESADRPFR